MLSILVGSKNRPLRPPRTVVNSDFKFCCDAIASQSENSNAGDSSFSNRFQTPPLKGPPQKKISFGGIPNSSSLMPCSTTWAHFCSAMVLPMWTMSSPKGVQKHSHSCSCQGCKATNHTGTLLNSPQPSGTFRKLPPEPTPAHTGTLRNLPEVASGTYTSTHWNPPEPSGSCHLPEVG